MGSLQLIRYKDGKRHLYDVTHDDSKFIKPVIEHDEIIYELQYKYFVAILECPVIERIAI